MSILAEMFKSLSLIQSKTPAKVAQTFLVSVRYKPKDKVSFKTVPKPGAGQAFRRIVHYPEEYTVEPLKITNLGGRDPVTGRKVCQRIGGGIKYKFHWVKWFRDGPFEGPPQEEKVIKIISCPERTANIALVAVKDEMKYILATENMQAGDIIKTSRFIPRNYVKPNEGDAYPLGALPMGTIVHNVQLHPSTEYTAIHSAGSFGTIKKILDEKIVVQLPSKREMALEPECMATVGRLSNLEHGSTPIGSPQRARELGIRPKSGLRHRKTGRFGRKIKPPKPIGYWVPPRKKPEFIQCTLPFIKS